MANRVFVRGDTHGNFDFLPYFCDSFNTDINDVLIILGDAGINFFGEANKLEIALKEHLATLPISLFCVRGNHDARPQYYYNMEKEYVRIGEVLCGTCYHDPNYPNQYFATECNSITLFNDVVALPINGAYSIDKPLRLLRGWQWFSTEQLNDYEKADLAEIAKNEKPKIILSHTCPLPWQPVDTFTYDGEVDNSMERWLMDIEESIHDDYEMWLFGHYHCNRFSINGDSRAIMLYEQFIELTYESGKLSYETLYF